MSAPRGLARGNDSNNGIGGIDLIGFRGCSRLRSNSNLPATELTKIAKLTTLTGLAIITILTILAGLTIVAFLSFSAPAPLMETDALLTYRF
jgi:hypothetical protein